jgi:hypothetical protein
MTLILLDRGPRLQKAEWHKAFPMRTASEESLDARTFLFQGVATAAGMTKLRGCRSFG